VGMMTEPGGTGLGWGPSLWGLGGDRNYGDGWGWARALVPVQLSSVDTGDGSSVEIVNGLCYLYADLRVCR